VAGGCWVGSHGPEGGELAGLGHVGLVCLKGVGLAEWRLCMSMDHQVGNP
jgi:hypothetical protein